MSNKTNTTAAQQTATATTNLSNRTKAAIELYRRAYLLFGDILEFNAIFQKEDKAGKMESYFHDLEDVGNDLVKDLQDTIGISVVCDQEAELEDVPSTLLYGITKNEQ
ncbi:MAG: hypothetical protein IJU81_05575 [Bacteroidales bacterium]|nr:hypothetical protein [Bacteroidales bacterium]